MKQKTLELYNKHYKKILILPALLIILSIAYLGYFYSQHGDILHKDVSLTGGTTITLQTNLLSKDVQTALSKDFPDLTVTSLSDNTGKQTNLVITVAGDDPSKITNALETYLGYKLTEQNSSIEFTGSSLSQDFYNQLIRAVVFAFLLMALVVFFVFGESMFIRIICLILTLVSARLTFPSSTFLNVTVMILALGAFGYSLYLAKTKKNFIYSFSAFAAFLILFFIPYYYAIIPLAILLFSIYTFVSVPSIAVILSAFADILMPLAIVDMLGMQISSAGIVAFLMLIGYSVDTDILLTTRVLRRKTESINKAIWGSFKTGITMTLTAIASVAVSLFFVYHYGSILNQIFTILIIGLGFDIFNTWITNTSMIKWYAEARHR
jgi:preprotein translocase subunit SecF